MGDKRLTYRTCNIFSAKKYWTLIDNICISTIYQSWIINKEICKRFLVYNFTNHYYPRFFVVFDNKKPVLIAPLCKHYGEKKYTSLGNFNGHTFYDFIYDNNVSDKQLEEYFCYLKDKLGNITVTHLHPSSRFVKILDKYSVNSSSNENVIIEFGNDYQAYYENLSKHSRQNMRTAYNRLNADNHQIKIKIVNGENLRKTEKKEVLDLYASRHLERYQEKTSFLKKKYLASYDFSGYLQFGKHVGYVSILYIDNKIAAFLSGLGDQDKHCIIVPRLSINCEYSRYSPGIVLINETIKSLCECGVFNSLDLSNGTETYKLQMGGKIYNKYNYKFGE